ncbi:TPA: XcbB/CpsF family capsular polysaccharide biosynthesis protein [Escherichia coli]
MNKTVLHINSNITTDEISLLLQASKYKYIHFEIIGKGDSCKNLIEFSYHDYNLKKQLIALTNAGFMSYVHRGNVTSLVHFDEIKNLWIPVKEKKFSINSDGIVYTLQRAACKINEKLLIVFSQMPIEPYSASLYRYFAKNFSTIDKYIGKNVSILRVADIGGVTGSFYLNTNALPTNADKIKSLILEVIEQCQIKSDDVVLYGCSKGGTAAVYHGLTNNYKIVAVDPILNDEHYINNKNDLHLIEGVFPQPKEELFKKVIDDYLINYKGNMSYFIVSQNSEQYKYIMDIINPIITYSTVANSINDKIKSHPDVGPQSIHMIVAMINMALSGIKLSNGIYDFV